MAKILLALGTLLASVLLALVIVEARNNQEVSRIGQTLLTVPKLRVFQMQD